MPLRVPRSDRHLDLIELLRIPNHGEPVVLTCNPANIIEAYGTLNLNISMGLIPRYLQYLRYRLPRALHGAIPR